MFLNQMCFISEVNLEERILFAILLCQVDISNRCKCMIKETIQNYRCKIWEVYVGDI